MQLYIDSGVPVGPRGLGADLLKGAAAIADFVLGDPRQRRTIYHLAEVGRIPTFKLGSTLCARRSTLLAWIREQEAGKAQLTTGVA